MGLRGVARLQLLVCTLKTNRLISKNVSGNIKGE